MYIFLFKNKNIFFADFYVSQSWTHKLTTLKFISRLHKIIKIVNTWQHIIHFCCWQKSHMVITNDNTYMVSQKDKIIFCWFFFFIHNSCCMQLKSSCQHQLLNLVFILVQGPNNKQKDMLKHTYKLKQTNCK